MTTTTTTTTTTSAGVDAHGNPMTGDPATIEMYDQSIDRLVRFHPDVIDIATGLVSQDTPVPMALAQAAYLHLMSTDPADLETARAFHGGFTASPGNEREQYHARAIESWLGGDWVGAARLLDELLFRWPTDVLALMFGHQLDFFVGDAQNLRDRPIRSLRAFDPQHPHIGFVRGMTAFGLEESGHYGQAAAAGLAAVEANPDDVWAVHAVAHTCEMQGLVDDGIRFMTSGGAHWESGNLFTVHNWWHLALFFLEAGQIDKTLEIYDAEVHNDGSQGVVIEMLDASAMLWRLLLDGVDTGDRFEAIAQAWAAKATAEPWYVFNDVHAVLALAGADRLAEARIVLDRLAGSLANGRGTNVRMTAEVGLPACRSIVAFAEGRFDDVIAELYPIRRVLNVFGGSHAQRDVLQRTLLEAALRAGRFELARALTAERLGVRDSNVYGWTRMASALRGLGDDRAADEADRTAGSHRARFAQAQFG